MINLLIVDSTSSFTKKLINQIVGKNERIRLLGIASSEKEALDICKYDAPQLIIVDADNINVSSFNSLEYESYFLFFTNSDSYLDSNNYVLKTSDITFIEEKINKIISKIDVNKTKFEIINTFGKLKFNLSRIGTRFLIESILYSYETKDLNLYRNLEKNVYPEIAKRNHTTPSNVKWVIIKSINEMYDRNYIENSLESVCNFFYFTNSLKPTAKVILTRMLVKLEEQAA